MVTTPRRWKPNARRNALWTQTSLTSTTEAVTSDGSVQRYAISPAALDVSCRPG